jgi:hypothetical protein
MQEFCEDVEMPYTLYKFIDENKEVIAKLAEVSRQAAILARCQRTVAERSDIFQIQAWYFFSRERHTVQAHSTPCGGTREGFICEVHIDPLRHFGAPV